MLFPTTVHFKRAATSEQSQQIPLCVLRMRTIAAKSSERCVQWSSIVLCRCITLHRDGRNYLALNQTMHAHIGTHES